MNSPDTDINNAPDYIKDFVASAAKNGPAQLLFDGSWCGHGEELYKVYHVVENGSTTFQIQLPDAGSEETFPIAVKLTSVANQRQFLIYNTRKHPASWHAFGENAKKESKFLSIHHCNKCSGTDFNVSVGFEVPVDSNSPNDTTWFALATQCNQCSDRTITFEDETA